MIRLLQRRLIIPRGDTGSFSVPVIKDSTDNIAVFTIFDETTRTKMFQKKIQGEGDVLNIAFTHSDTVNLKPGKYVWDIKYYSNPEYVDDELVNGEEIDSYYAGFSLPVCEIRETADNYLVSPDAPTATLSPEYLEIVTSAIHELNEAIRKTQENVEHYPEIRNEVWYTWDTELGDYVSTGVRANGIVGNGIESAVLNDDYTLTLNFTDGTSFTSPSIRGRTGNGIYDIVLNNDYTLSIIYTNGEVFTTPSIRGPIGPTPQFSIGNVQDGAIAAATITGTAENPVLNLTLPNAHVPTRTSQLENDSNYAVDANYVHTDNNYTTTEKNKLSGIAVGAEVNVNADWNANSGDAQILNKPTNISAFTNDVGYLTEHQDISGKLDVSLKGTANGLAELDNTGKVPAAQLPSYVDDVLEYANIASLPGTGQSGKIYVIKDSNKTYRWSGSSYIEISASLALGETSSTAYRGDYGARAYQHATRKGNAFESGLYKITTNEEGHITDATAIVKKDITDLGIPGDVPTKISELDNDSGYLTSYTETDPTVPAWAKAPNKPTYTAQEVGALPANTVIPEVPVNDVQINGTSILNNNVANVPMASYTSPGVVTIGSGLFINRANKIITDVASAAIIKAGTDPFRPISTVRLPEAVFYGLAKIAGQDESSSEEPAGTYTPQAKGAIQSMLGISDLIAPEENDLVASKAYAVGDIFTAKGKLYKVTTAIAINGTIILQNNGETISEANAEEIQIEGTFIKNTDIASTTKYGVVKVKPGGGTSIDSVDKTLIVYPASSAHIKAASATYMPVTPTHQHESTFYGLAKAAGADMASSSNTVGTYTDEAKIAIQKMLGIYEAPWELIREDTFTNAEEADYEITVDKNGQSFELTDLMIFFETPKQETFAKKRTHHISFFHDTTMICNAEVGSYTQDANTDAHGSAAFVLQQNGIIVTCFKRSSTSTNNGNMAMRYLEGFNNAADALRIFDTEIYINKVNIGMVTGTGHYILFGKRKWN